MRELSKAVLRWNRDSRFATRYLVGNGIDIGCGPDPLTLYAEFFPLITDCRPWDLLWGTGDAQRMEGVDDATYDFVVSSHCLEHLESPIEALAHWLRITKPGGHLIIIIPDEDRYEQGVWPSTFNPDHKFSFTAFKATRSWSPMSRNVLTLLLGMGEAELLKLEVLDSAHRYLLPRCDQTRSIGESGIELVLRKRTKAELDAGGRLPPDGILSEEGRAILFDL
jgi:SAM-dependent methyltransferase